MSIRHPVHLHFLWDTHYGFAIWWFHGYELRGPRSGQSKPSVMKIQTLIVKYREVWAFLGSKFFIYWGQDDFRVSCVQGWPSIEDAAHLFTWSAQTKHWGVGSTKQPCRRKNLHQKSSIQLYLRGTAHKWTREGWSWKTARLQSCGMTFLSHALNSHIPPSC